MTSRFPSQASQARLSEDQPNRPKLYREKSKSHTDLSSLASNHHENNKQPYNTTNTTGPLSTIIIIVFTILACHQFATSRFHWLPSPQHKEYHNGNPIFSSKNVMHHMKTLEDYGHRLVGLQQHSDTADYIYDYLKSLPTNGNAKIEVEFQTVDSSHRFDIAGKVCHKMYQDVVNVIAKISSQDSTEDGIVINTHYDTNPGTLGAADAASGVGIMLEVARIVSTSRLKNPLILLFNGAEETLQDGSHGFILHHPFAKSSKALINLEACGHNGREALFQANSHHLIKAYQKGAKYPHGSVFGNDVFGTGLIVSDTDYRQFMEYTNAMVGLDMAYYTESYIYHTMLDTTSSMKEGAVQHFGENILGITQALIDMDIHNVKREYDTVYYDFFGWFVVVYRWSFGLILHLGLCLVSMRMILTSRDASGALKTNGVALISVVLSLVASIVAPVALTFLFRMFAINNLAWFKREHYATLEYGLISLWGMLLVQYLSRKSLDQALASVHGHQLHSHSMERRTILAILTFFTLVFFIASIFKIGSSFLLMYHVLAALILSFHHRGYWTNPTPIQYYIMACIVAMPLQIGYSISILKLFIPLMGRAGAHTPSDVIVSVLTGLTMFLCCWPLLPAFHRLGEFKMQIWLKRLFVLGLLIAFWRSRVFPYDDFYAPKRLFVQHRFNQTSNTSHVDFAHADAHRSSFEQILTQVVGKHDKIGQAGREWVSMYPLNYFIESTAVEGSLFTPTGNFEHSHDGPLLSLSSTEKQDGEERVLNITFKHTNLILPTVTLLGEVVKWDINSTLATHHFDPFNPMVKIAQDSHTVRVSNGQGTTEFSIQVHVKGKLLVEVTAMDPRCWGIRKGDLGVYGPETDQERRKLEGEQVTEERWEGGEVLRKIKEKIPSWNQVMWVATVTGTWTI